MAERWAVATGNWSATGTWNGGTLPGVADDVHANGFTVAIDQDISVLSLRTMPGTTPVAGGVFNATVARNITADLRAGTTTVLTVSHTSGATTITGSIYGSTTTSVAAVSHSSSGDLVLIGDARGGSVGLSPMAIVSNGGGDLSITGNVYGPTAGSNYGITIGGNKTVTVVGNITGGTGPAIYVTAAKDVTFIQSGGNISGGTASNSAGISFFNGYSTYTLNIEGNLIGGDANNAPGILTYTNIVNGTITGNLTAPGASGGHGYSTTAAGGTVTITGNVTGSVGYGISFSGVGGNLNVIGTVTGGNASTIYGIANSSTSGLLTVTGNVIAGAGGAGILASGAGGTTIINGNVTAGAAANTHGISCSGTHVLTVNGTVTGGSSVTSIYGINYSGSNQVTVNGQVIGGIGIACYGVISSGGGGLYVREAVGNDYPNSGITNYVVGAHLNQIYYRATIGSFTSGSGGVPGIGQGCFFFDPSVDNVAKMRQTNAGSITTMNDASGDHPLPANVRYGTVYDFGNKTGTMAVPLPAVVDVGVAVDATTGVAALSSASISAVVGPLVTALN